MFQTDWLDKEDLLVLLRLNQSLFLCSLAEISYS